MPELPDEKQARFISDYGVTAYDAMVLTLERETADYYEACVAFGGTKRDGKAVANILNADVAAQQPGPRRVGNAPAARPDCRAG